MVFAGVDLCACGDVRILAFRFLGLCLQEGDVIIFVDYTTLVGNAHMQPAGLVCIMITPPQGIDFGYTHGEVPFHPFPYTAALHLDGLGFA